MKSVKLIFVFSLFMLLKGLQAQSLTPEQALQKALRNNPVLAGAEGVNNIAKLSNTKGRAGLLPQIALAGGWNSGSQNANLTFNNGTEISRKGAGTSAINGGLQLNQNVFNGFKSQANKNRLDFEATSASYALQMQRLMLTEQVLNAYYTLVNEQHWLRQVLQLDSFYMLKLKQSNVLFQNGKLSESDVLQSEADLSMQQVRSSMRKTAVIEAMSRLNALMAEPPNAGIETTVSEIPLDMALPDTGEAALLRSNATLQQLKADWEAMKQNEKAAIASLYPSLSLQLNGTALNSRSDVGLLLRNQTTSSSMAVNLNYPLFNGGVIRKDISIAKFRTTLSGLAYKQALLEAKANLYIAIANWKSALEQVRLQQEAIQRYQRMLAIAEAAFKLGKFNRVEVAQTQTQYETALAGLMETRLRAIQQYHALKRLLSAE